MPKAAKTKKFIKAKFCSPAAKPDKISCMSKQSLQNMAKAWNKTHKKEVYIPYKGRSKAEIWQNIRHRLSSKCSSEICWLNQDFMNTLPKQKRESLESEFRPRRPEDWKSNYSWVSTSDINDVMFQYDDKYADFLFLGALPLDCTYGGNLSCHMKNLRISHLVKRDGIKKIGIVYNLDYSWMTGSHWVAVWIDASKSPAQLIYFDSAADPPPDEIKTLLETYAAQLQRVGKKTEIIYNTKKHQYGDTQCGVYAMFFLIQSLNGKSLSQINRMRISDGMMAKVRDCFYRPNKI